MDDTPDRYAYRCLPLTIANAHGWELLSPCGFKARWTGGDGADAVDIRLDPGMEGREAPVSLFGQGTITFHVEGLFRTPEGWNLWVGGSPNAAKDGIAPLGAVIETDWSPYTFTMNWRFTRPNHWVRFEENEPFCFFFPVQRQPMIEAVPVIRPLAEAPELEAAFTAWSQSRADFHAWVKANAPTAAADQWQKLYFRGVDPAGNACPVDHQTKLRPKPFRQPDGSNLDPPPMKARPEPPAALPPAARDAIAAAAKAPVSGSGADAMSRMRRSQIGFDVSLDPTATLPSKKPPFSR